MSTARDLLRRTFSLIGVLAEGEPLSANQLQDGLLVFNEMLSSWSTENLIIFQRSREEFAAPSGNAAPTMGPTPSTFVTTRPVEIESIKAKNGSIEYDVPVINFERWSNIGDKAQTGTVLSYVFPNYGETAVTLNLWPVPSANITLDIYSRKALTTFTADTTVDLPPGYARAIRYNLAIELCSEYGRSASAEIVTIAKESKAFIKRLNNKPDVMVVDPALMYRRGFDINKGE